MSSAQQLAAMPALEGLPAIGQSRPRTSDAPTPALVVSTGCHALHHGRLGVIRSLGRMGVPVYAVVEDRFTPPALSRYLTGAFVWDTRSLDEERFLEGMAAIGRRIGRPTIVIPIGDVPAIFLAEHAAALQPWFILPPQPAALPRTLANKRELYQLCKQIQVACPETVVPNSLDDVREFVERVACPIVVKAAESWLLPEGGRTTQIARTPEEAFAIYRSAARDRGANLLLQEYIDPLCGEDWFYHGYRNPLSNCEIGFTGRKLRSYPAFAGPTTLGQSIENQVLRQQAEALLSAVSYAGAMDLDFRLDRRDGQYKLLDFNPRIGAQFRIFEDELGMNIASALYLDLAGKRVGRAPSVEGRTFIAEFHDLAASVSYARRGKLTLREWRQSLKGDREWAWLCRDDLLPFAMTGVRLALRVATRALHRKRASTTTKPLPRYVRGRRERAAQKKHATA